MIVTWPGQQSQYVTTMADMIDNQLTDIGICHLTSPDITTQMTGGAGGSVSPGLPM